MLPVERLRMDIDDVVDGPLGIERFTDDFESIRVRYGAIYNDALETDMFNDRTAYVELIRSSYGPLERVFVGSQGEIVGSVYETGSEPERFVVKADKENALFEYAVNVAKDFGVDFRSNEAQIDSNDIHIRTKRELGIDSFEDWFKSHLESHADKFVHIDFNQFVEVYENNQLWIDNTIEEILENGLFNPSASREELRDEIVGIVDSVKMVLDHPDAAKVAEAFNVDGSVMVDLDIDDVEYKIEAATVDAPEVKSDEPTVKQKNKMKP